jgi:hypothetical protein
MTAVSTYTRVEIKFNGIFQPESLLGKLAYSFFTTFLPVFRVGSIYTIILNCVLFIAFNCAFLGS